MTPLKLKHCEPQVVSLESVQEPMNWTVDWMVSLDLEEEQSPPPESPTHWHVNCSRHRSETCNNVVSSN